MTLRGKTISVDFPFESRYVNVLGCRIHYVEQGSGDPILFLHGNPAWSYVWRNVIPYAAKVGRAVAMDLVGMGKSDKPDIEYRFFDHIKYVEGFINAMGLKNVILVGHDWGSALAFQYAMQNENNVKGIAFMEPVMFTGSIEEVLGQYSKMYKAFRTPVIGWDLIVNQNTFIERVLPAGIVRKLSEEEMNQYREPFRDPSTRRPIWRWPNDIPFAGEPKDMADLVNSYVEKLKISDIPKLLFYNTPGLLLTPARAEWCRQNMRKVRAVDAGPGIHYPQEDNPHLVGEELVNWVVDL